MRLLLASPRHYSSAVVRAAQILGSGPATPAVTVCTVLRMRHILGRCAQDRGGAAMKMLRRCARLKKVVRRSPD